MQKIEGGLHTFHADVRQTGVLPEMEDEVGGDPFVRINFVAPGSPAELAVCTIMISVLVQSRQFSILQLLLYF
jgi:hypothetical protein